MPTLDAYAMSYSPHEEDPWNMMYYFYVAHNGIVHVRRNSVFGFCRNVLYNADRSVLLDLGVLPGIAAAPVSVEDFFKRKVESTAFLEYWGRMCLPEKKVRRVFKAAKRIEEAMRNSSDRNIDSILEECGVVGRELMSRIQKIPR